MPEATLGGGGISGASKTPLTVRTYILFIAEQLRNRIVVIKKKEKEVFGKLEF
jgi:hypothetical protein